MSRRYLLDLLNVLPTPSDVGYAAVFGYKDVDSEWWSHVHLLLWFEGADSPDLRRRAALLYSSGGRHAHVKALDDDGDEPYDYVAKQAAQTATWETGDYRNLRDYAVHHALAATNDGPLEDRTVDYLASWLRDDGFGFSAWEVQKALHRFYNRGIARAATGGLWYISSKDALTSPVAARHAPSSRTRRSTTKVARLRRGRRARAVIALGKLVQALARRSEVATPELWVEAQRLGYPFGKNTFYGQLKALAAADVLWFRRVRSLNNRTYHLWQVRGTVDLRNPLPVITAALYGDGVKPPASSPRRRRRRRPGRPQAGKSGKSGTWNGGDS